MIRPLRRLDPTGVLILAGCLTIGVGCSATRGARLRGAEGARSSASVGDQPLPPTVGLSGSKVTVDTPEAEPYRNPKARISGRVVDDQGRPVAGAEVRLADGSSKAGRDVRTTTDDSGAFTLAGLRPGSGYLLMAEANFGDDQGTLTGQQEADTAETGVQIRLGDATPQRRSEARTARTRQVSDRVDGDLKPTSGGVNTEDLGPPAEAADAVGPEGNTAAKAAAKRFRRSRSDSKRGQPAAGWHKPGADAPVAEGPAEPEPATQADEPDDTPTTLDPGPKAQRPRAGRASRTPITPKDDGDDVNPLPLAIPADRASRPAEDESTPPPVAQARTKPRARVVPRPANPADAEPPAGALALGPDSSPAEPEPAAESSPSGLEPMPSLASVAAAVPAVAVAATEEPAPTLADGGEPRSPEPPPPTQPTDAGLPIAAATTPPTNPASSTPGELVSSPGAATNPSAGYNPFALAGVPLPASVAPATTTKAVPAASLAEREIEPTASIEPTAAPDADLNPDAGAATPPKSKKWGDLPPLAAGTAGAGASKAALTGASAIGRTGSFFGRRTRSAAAPAAKPDAEASCQFDSRANRLDDFQLPDLTGDPVRFRDFDADYILLDFWGTWCAECVDAIPELVARQKKYGPTRLKVVGIACEQAPPEKRKAIVAAAAQRLGINFPVLMTSLDGDCPVQRAFKVHVYPTMVLLDRQGNVLYTGEGSTESNWFRLDKAIATADRARLAARR